MSQKAAPDPYKSVSGDWTLVHKAIFVLAPALAAVPLVARVLGHRVDWPYLLSGALMLLMAAMIRTDQLGAAVYWREFRERRLAKLADRGLQRKTPSDPAAEMAGSFAIGGLGILLLGSLQLFWWA